MKGDLLTDFAKNCLICRQHQEPENRVQQMTFDLKQMTVQTPQFGLTGALNL